MVHTKKDSWRKGTWFYYHVPDLQSSSSNWGILGCSFYNWEWDKAPLKCSSCWFPRVSPKSPQRHESESEVAQSCPTLCDPMDCSLPGSSVHGIFQARVLEWGAISIWNTKSWIFPWVPIKHYHLSLLHFSNTFYLHLSWHSSKDRTRWTLIRVPVLLFPTRL